MTRYAKLLALLFVISQSIFMQKAYSQDVELDPHTIWFKTENSTSYVRFSPDGKKIYFLDGHAFYVRDSKNGEVLHIRNNLESYPISTMEFDTLRRKIYIPAVGGTRDDDFFPNLAVYDMDTYERLPNFEGVKVDGKGATTIAISPDANRLVVEYGNVKSFVQGIRIFDLNSGKIIAKREWDITQGAKYELGNFLFDKTGQQLFVSKSEYGTDHKGNPIAIKRAIEIWDANTLDSLGTKEGTGVISISNTGKYLAHIGTQGSINVFDLQENTSILSINNYSTRDIYFSNDEKYLIIACYDFPFGIEVWDLEKKEKVYRYSGNLSKTIKSADYSPATNQIIATRGYTYLLGLPQGVSVETEHNDFTFTIQPNPIQSGTYTANFILDKSEPVELYLSDILGNRLKYYINGMLEAGIHQIPIEVSNLANGVYFLSLQMNDRIYTEKMIVE